MSFQLDTPKTLSPEHVTDDFSCGESILDNWLKRRAFANQLNGASRTFVVVDEQKVVMGYYALAAGAVTHRDVTANIRRNMPDPLPVIVLARLAVDVRAQGIKLGAALLKDAVLRVHSISENTGVRALVVHALNEKARQFYEYYGFKVSPTDPMSLLLKLNAAHKK